MSEKEWTLFMSGTTYLKVAEAASILGFESVEEMFFDYDIQTNDLIPEGKVIMGKNVVLGDLLEERPALRCDHPDHRGGQPLVFPMVTPSQPYVNPITWQGGTITVSNTANLSNEQREAFATIMTAGK